MNPNKALWEKGDFTRIAQSMRESGVSLVERIAISDGLKVLDLGCGDGTTAVPAAKLGAEVLGVDIATNLVQDGNKRAEALGLKSTLRGRRCLEFGRVEGRSFRSRGQRLRRHVRPRAFRCSQGDGA